MGLITPVPYDSKCKEGCICNDGYILSGDVCVPLSQCGCFYDDNYYRVGQVFYPSGQCQERCMCKQDGEVMDTVEMSAMEHFAEYLLK